jgi:lysophospholipase L1-like esterase
MATLPVTLVAQPAHAADPLRILLTGDSITHGRHGDYTWRYRLDREFRRQSVAVDFVGSRRGPFVQAGYQSASYAVPGFDSDHFAQYGVALRHMIRSIGPEVREQQPDVVVLAAGINDFRHYGDDPDIVADTAGFLREWIDAVRDAKPDTRILLSPVLQVDTPKSATLNPQSSAYNQQLRAIAADETSTASPITVATTDQGWNPYGVMAYDGLHPSATGETFIAQRIAEALHREGFLPAAPHIYDPPTTWNVTQRPTRTVDGRRLTLTWSAQSLSGARLALRRVGHAWTTPPALYTAGRASITLAPGVTYDVRIRLVRGRMTGPWGPIIRVHIPAPPRPAAPARVTVNATGVHWTAAPRAAAYVVKFRKIGKKRWATRRTSSLRVYVKRVKVAQVRAVNAGGTSAWRRDVR